MARTFVELSEFGRKLRRDPLFSSIKTGNNNAAFIEQLKLACSDNSEVEQDVGLREIYLEIAIEYLSTGKVNVPNLLRRARLANLTQHDIRPVLSRLNEDFVVEHGHEITAHGLIRSFRFWSEEEKRNYLNLANDMLGIIQRKFPDSVFGYGFVLSMERDGNLMPHDDDIDIIIAADSQDYATITDALSELSLYLSAEGLKLYGSWPSHRKVFKEGGKTDIDVFVGLKEDEYVSFIPGPRKKLLYRDVFPALSRDFMGIECLIPADPNAYLSAIYGDDWRDPKPNWHHDWSLKKHADVLRKTLPGYPFQASSLMAKGAEWAVLDGNKTLISVHSHPPEKPNAMELKWLAMQESLCGMA